MKKYVRATTSPKLLSLDMFDVDEHDYVTPYAEKHCVDYELHIDGYRIKIYELFSKLPYNISFTYPSGYTGEAGGFKTAQDAVNYLNDHEWWNMSEPSEAEVQRAIRDEWNPTRENFGASKNVLEAKGDNMKKAIRASTFANQVWLVDRDGNPVTKLMPDGYGYYKVESINAVHFAPGDVYYVKEFESEID